MLQTGPASNTLQWIETLQAKGLSAFSLDEARQEFPNHSEMAVKLSLNRLSKKEKILSVHKGYYIIIPPQYASRGILPPVLYMDNLMKFLNRPYYIGLLNAAAFYGASHQQPQEFFVFTNLPALRQSNKKGVRVNYISKKIIPEHLLESRKTETGYIKISSPELTAADLIQFEKRIGGINRAATVLNELTDEIKPEKFNQNYFKSIPVSTLQRMGFLLDKILDKEALSTCLFEECKNAGMNFFRIPLAKSGKTSGFPYDEKWRIIVNTEIEIDE